MRRKKGITANPNIAIGYVRVSTDEQHLGPEAQEAAIREFVGRQGWTLHAVFCDHRSGVLPIEARPGLCAALEAGKLSGAGRLIFARYDRLTRNPEHMRPLTRLFSSVGMVPTSADGVANGDAPADNFIRATLVNVAELERELTIVRTRAALAVKKARFECVGQPPFGFRREGDKLVPCPEHVRAAALIGELAAAGYSSRKIAAALNARGIPAGTRPMKGKTMAEAEPGKWYATNVCRVLQAQRKVATADV